MKFRSGSIPVLLFLPVLTAFLAAGAGDTPGLDGWEGRYSFAFQNALMDGKKYRSQDSLELLKFTETSAYFNLHLDWANGHSCDLAGIADQEPTGGLVYRAPSLDQRTCVFRIKATREALVLGDEGGACRLIFCGARGLIADVQFKFKDRKKLSRDRIRKSEDFDRAVEEYKRRSR